MQVDLLQAAAVVAADADTDRRAARRPPDAHSARAAPICRRSISTAARSASTATSSSCAIRRRCKPERADPDAARYLAPEPFIESDAPEIVAEAEKAVRGVTGTRARAERLTRYVNALLDKKPTVSLPSAREVLRTKVGDCNEHTALYVAMARALGIPARIAVGLVYIHGAFYYHAWPEVYIDEGLRTRAGLWLPVDPTLNQFPADATHLRLARGGLDKQAAILPLIGQSEDGRARRRAGAELDADSGRQAAGSISARWRSPIPAPRVGRAARAADDCHPRSGQALRHVHGGRRRQPRRARPARSTASSGRTAPARRRRSG